MQVEQDGQTFETYLRNPRLRGMDSKIAFTTEQIIERAKCMNGSDGVIYFIEKYVKIVNVDEGFVNFNMWDFQKEMVRTYCDNRFAINLCPRQVGKSTTAICGFMLHYILFNERKDCCILAHKGDTARELLARLKEAYEALPLWMQQGIREWNKGSIELENGSTIIAASTSASSIRGRTFSLVFLDEFAFVPDGLADDFFNSVYPTIASGKTTKCIIVSTPNGMNHFYKKWMDSVEGRTDYVPIRVYWKDVPGRDEEWKKETIKNSSERQFSQEHDCEFLGSAHSLIEPTALQNMVFMEPIHSENDVDIFELPQDGHNYVMTIDTGKGLGQDYSAFSVIDVTNIPYKQVAKYKNNKISHLIYPNVIKEVAERYNKAFLLIELNDNGGEVANILFHDYEYENLFMTETNGRNGQQLSSGFGKPMSQLRMGVVQSSATKNNGCANLKSLVEDQKLIINDFDTISEMTTFASKGKSFEAEEGKNDDLVMTLVLFGWLARQQMFKELVNSDFRKVLYEAQQKAIEESMLPLFSTDDLESGGLGKL
jgi:hypothetical protein